MARVVERRKGIPWALIAFVFLFLVAATLAVLWRIDLDERTAKVAELNDQLGAYTRVVPAPADEPSKSVWQKRMEPLLSEARRAGGRGVIQQLVDREQPLIDVICGLGKSLTAEQAAAEARKVVDANAANDPAAGLVKVIETLVGEMNSEKAKTKALEQARDAAIEEGKGLNKQLTDLKAAQDKEREAFKASVDDLTTQKGVIDKKQQDELARIKKEYEDRIEKLNADANRYQGEIDKQKSDLRKSAARIDILSKKLDVFIKPKKMRAVTYQSCGQVVRTEQKDNVAYINLGEKDRVVPGMTFAVHSADRGMPQVVGDGGAVADAVKLKGKAQLYVVQTFPKVSLCRIEWLANAGDPIVQGDLIANLAFDPARTFRFVVIGDFDLFSAGKPQEADADHVKFLIRRFRGEVSKDLDDQTDFLIVGTKPVETPAMEGEESAQAVKARQEKEKRRAEYERVRKLADSRDLPILNANQFLALVGYTPQSTLKTFGPQGR